MPTRRTFLALSLSLLAALGCAMGGDATGSKLQTSGFEGGCFDQPGGEFTPENFADVEVFVERGDAAWEFTLPSLDGDDVTLSELLKTKPVVLFTGSYTCPVYRRNRKKIDQLARKLGDKVHVVIVYGPEAHPKTDNSPYSGKDWSKPDKYSDFDLAKTMEERVDHAKQVGSTAGVLELVEPLDNPLWCTYGTAPNAAYLIDQDGLFYAVHDWFDPPTMVESIAALFDRRPPPKKKPGRRRQRP